MKTTSDIESEAEKLVRRHQQYAAKLHDEAVRRLRRSGSRPAKVVQSPAYWAVDPGFDPYHVRTHAAHIGYAIDRSLANRTYVPRPAVSYDVPKDGGGTRSVSVFQVADNAVSRRVFKNLMAKNSSRFSSHCYAYRTDVTLHDAILDIATDIRGKRRLFVAEFDFTKYFDNIEHDHVERVLTDQRFFVTDLERFALRSFLSAPTVPLGAYVSSQGTPRQRGIPQGTSVSLFLANLVAQPLDRELERIGVGFARFADDTVIWSEDYSAVCRAANALEEAAVAIGVDINFSKSPGVSILTPDSNAAEFKSKRSIEYLGHSLSAAGISIRPRAIARIKQWLSYLVYANLIQEPQRGVLVAGRVAPSIDRDYVVMIGQIRRYLYGDLSETQLRRYLGRSTPRISYRGLLSFYPLVDDDELLRELDGWLLHTVHAALRLRGRLFTAGGIGGLPTPHGLPPSGLLTLIGTSSTGSRLDLRLPSFARMARLVRKASRVYGANAIANPASLYNSPLNAGRRYDGT